MSGHTPGPWYWINQTGGGPALVWGEGDDEGGVVCEVGMTREGITIWNEADAPLIASAPDLLEALEHVYLHYGEGWDKNKHIMKDAIAKARGES